MPKLRLPAAEIENRKIVSTIKCGMEMQNVTHDELALAARMTRQTLYRRYKRPDEFRLYELKRVSKKLKIPLDKLLCG